MGSLTCALGVVGFIRHSVVRSCVPRGSLSSSWVVGFTRAPWVLLGSSAVVGFPDVHLGVCWVHSRVFPGGRWVHQGSLGSLARTLGFVGFIRGRWVHSGCRRFHPVSLTSLARALGVAAFIRSRCVQSRAPCVSLGLSGVIRFTRVRTSIIPGSCDHSRAHWRSLSSSGFVGFTVALPRGR